MSGTALTDRFDEAIKLATDLHRQQRRKGGDVPYMAHLLQVAGLVLEFGGDEDTAIAALLHDAVEDQGGTATDLLIRKRFGDAVANVVLECSDSVGDPKPAWGVRKEEFIASIPALSPAARLVSLADKMHNVRSITADYRQNGDRAWDHFKGKREGTLWYYRQVTAAFRAAGNDFLVGELERGLQELLALTGESKF